MKCIAIDDEPVALSVISQFCERIGGIDLWTYSDPVVGINRVMETVPDILFLDIEMNGISGIELAKSLPKGTCLIFTTAHARFALDGFDLNAVDFLHKPFPFSRFEKAVQKARELLLLLERVKNTPPDDEEITVKVEYQNVRIPVSAIQYIEAMDNYIRIYLSDSRTVISQMNLKKIAGLLPAHKFIRIHKSYIVPVHKIARFTRKYVVLACKSVELPVGRLYSDDFMRRLETKENDD